ncbi:MAG: serine/threonine-protein kinase [Myxococcota bacterium]|nr:serine/threonine-protein kinase [Myxococcota bacterium]
MEPQAPSQSGSGRKFKLIRCIGKGGFGEVYIAEMSTASGFAKTVAIKLMLQDVEGKADIESRMKDEARMLGMLRHRTIVQADDLITLSGRTAVVMEYIPGTNHSTLVKRENYEEDIPPRVSLYIIRQIADALDVAYHRPSTVTNKPLKVLHRDIKPGNVRITPDGEVKVLDFGIARSDHMNREAKTQEYALGSLPYMSPELLDGKEASPASDIYALGVTFYETLARQRFGWAGESEELHTSQLEHRLDQIDFTSFDDQTGAVRELLQRMLAYDVHTRPSASETAKACRDIDRKIEGPSLEEWAPDIVRELGEIEEPESGELSGQILFEDVSSARLKSTPRDMLDTLALGMDSDAETMALPTDETVASSPTLAPIQLPPEKSPASTGSRDRLVLLILLLVTGIVFAMWMLKPWTEEAPVQPPPTRNAKQVKPAPEPPPEPVVSETAGTLKIETRPESYLTIDGKAAGRADKAHSLEPGQYTIKLTTEDQRSHEEVLIISTQKTVELCWDFALGDYCPGTVSTPAPAQTAAPRQSAPPKAKPAAPKASKEPVKVRLNSSPFGIKVLIDDETTCETPACNLSLVPGKHVLVFKDGDNEVRHVIDVQPGGKTLWTYRRSAGAVQ